MKATYSDFSLPKDTTAANFSPPGPPAEARPLPVGRPDVSVPLARFGVFEVDLEARELRKHGLRLRLEEKPFLILELLLENAGRVITRKALRERLWPDTHVHYDQNLNTAVNKLRDLLGDSAASPRFIETLPRLGYRFIAPVVKPEQPSSSPKHRLATHELNPAAHEAYLRGRYFFSKRTEESLRKAIACFETALSIEPSCARSYSGIADCYSLLCWYAAMSPSEAGPQSASAARCAIARDPALSEPRASLALVLFWYEWNWAGAEKEFLRAIELNPSYAAAHHFYAAYLNALGRFEEAQAAQWRARELDPHSLMFNMAAADSLFFTRNYDAAIKHLLALLEQAPNFLPAHFNLGRVYLQAGMLGPAIAAFEKVVNVSRNHVALCALAHAYAVAGRPSEARIILADLTQEIPGRHVPAPILARIHLGLGEPEPALACLEKGLAERSYWMVFLNSDPLYDSLRSNSRFTRLLAQIFAS